MTRIINGLDINIWRTIKESLPRAANLISEDPEAGTCVIELNVACILKVYDDEVVIDLGGEKEIFNRQDFYNIEIY